MKVKDLLEHYKHEPKPEVSAAAAVGVNPLTLQNWEKRNGLVPLHRAYMAAAKTGLDVGEEDYQK